MLLSKCLNFIQVSDCWSDSIMRNERCVVRSPKCSAMKLEAAMQPEVVCCFPTGSGVSLPKHWYFKLRCVDLIRFDRADNPAQIFRDETWSNESCCQLFC